MDARGEQDGVMRRRKAAKSDLKSRVPIEQPTPRPPDRSDQDKPRLRPFDAVPPTEPQQTAIGHFGAAFFEQLAPQGLLPILASFRPARREPPSRAIAGDQDNFAG